MGHRGVLIGRRGGVGSAVGLPFGVFTGVGRAVGLLFVWVGRGGVTRVDVDVGAGVVVGPVVRKVVGSPTGTAKTGSLRRGVNGPTTAGSRAGPLVVVAGVGLRSCEATAAGGSGSGRKGELIVGPPRTVLSRRPT